MFKHTRNVALMAALFGFSSLLSAEIHVSTDDALKAAVKKAPPEYPQMAKQMHVAGKVEVQITIDAEGNVEEVKILSGNALLTGGVVNALKKWKFTPFTAEGSPTKAIAALEFEFKM
jgi:TonB family protein